jgi:perosamine synthetase
MNERNSSMWDQPWPQPKSIRIPIADVQLSQSTQLNVREVIDSNWVGPGGKFNFLAESELTRLSSMPSLLVSNGSVALSLALAALGIGADDEVLIPSLTFAATASAVVRAGARPVFCDSNESDWLISVDSMKKALNEKTRAIIVVHLYGVLANMKEIMEFAREYNLRVVEDSAEALFANSNSKYCGDVTTYSFFANKLITSGEGGAVCTRDPDLFHKMEILRGQGMDPTRRYFFLEAGYNFRMSNLQAAVLVGQLTELEKASQMRETQENFYDNTLRPSLIRPKPDVESKRIPWIYTAKISGISMEKKLALAKNLATAGIETRPVFYPLDEMPAFWKFRRTENKVAQMIACEGISLPTGIHIREEQQNEICAFIKREIGEISAIN